MYELAQHLFKQGATEGNAFNKGGTIRFGKVTATMVPASHSSSIGTDNGPVYMGSEIGYVIKGDGHTIYLSGDTTIMADMDWIGDYFKPDIGILSAGGYYTMDMAGAAYAAKRYFDFKTVIPCHYRTFPALEQSAEVLAAGLPGVTVIEPQVMQAIAL
jgi:L-ascorbate metabolism protein UlaG (beta-lactamase superfamily)